MTDRHIFAALAILSILAGITFGVVQGWDTAWGWFTAAVPYFILARKT
jgi:uncharacterized membrane protein YdjX (TVP38/TMEM64 family)